MEITGYENEYDELYAEMLRLIPVYSNEWTNYNNTDPGITILQSLTQLAIWQNNAIEQPNSEIAQKLLELLSLKTSGFSAACVTAGINGASFLPTGTRLLSGGSCYELSKEEKLYTGKATLLSSKTMQEQTELSHLLYSNMSTFVYPFGEKTTVGTEFYIGFDEPICAGEKLNFYMDFNDEANARVPFDEENKLVFAEINWEYYTDDGFVKAQIVDDTFGFMRSGTITFSGENNMQKIDMFNKNCYCIRATLQRQQYDCPPKLFNVFCNPLVFEEKKTLARRMFFPYKNNAQNDFCINISNVQDFIPLVLVRCEDNFWRKCDFSRHINAENELVFSLAPIAENADFSPLCGEKCVTIILYQPETAMRMELGSLYGYDAQRVELPKNGVLSDSFETMLVLRDESGNIVFSDEENADYHYKYHIDSKSSELVIDDVPFGVDNRLIITSCAVTTGSKGNIRPQELKNSICSENITVINSTQGTGGADGLTIKELKEKLIYMLRNPEIAVANKDYENMTRKIAGLRIDKVCAYSNENDNVVKIAIKPVSEESFPPLLPVYIKAVYDYFEKHKLITTQIEVVKPTYLPIDVYLSLQAKPYATNVQQIIKQVLSQEVNYYESGCDFGSMILYNRLYSRLEQLDCVSYIQRMSIDADTSFGQATIDGNDIQLSKCALPYLRNVQMILM